MRVADPSQNRPEVRRPWDRIGAYLSSRGSSGAEIAAATLLCLCIFLPGLWSYSLVDPWETHYAEVGRRMLKDHDLVHTQWQNEGFRSKPVLVAWLIAGGMRLFGFAADGGYSGEMVSSPLLLFAVRFPFALFATLGAVALWWMLAQLVNRRVAWLSLLFVATTPFYFLVARQAITDILLVGPLIAALACFALAAHAEDEPLGRFGRGLDAYRVFLATLVAFVGWQVVYYFSLFYTQPSLAPGVRMYAPHLILPGVMLAGLLLFVFWSATLRHAWFELFAAGPLAAGCAALLVGLGVAKTTAVAVAVALFAGMFALRLRLPIRPGALASLWAPVTTKRQLYMLWFYFFLAIGVLAKGLPGLGLAGLVCLAYIAATGSWRLLAKLEILRGILVCLLVVVPWHFAMWLKDGWLFIRDYIIIHNLNRAAAGVHGDRGTFDYFISQIGIGMWPWVGFVPAAVAHAALTALGRNRQERIRLLMGLWAIAAVALFCLVETKFHHYVLPAVPALCVLVAFLFEDMLAGRSFRLGLVGITAAVIIVLLTRDLMSEQKQLIELFVYRYDRPWPSGAPWNVDLGWILFAFGLVFALLAVGVAISRALRLVLCSSLAVGFAFALWAGNHYMSHAGEHWGQRTAVLTYYQQRQIHGIDIRYHGLRQLHDEWHDFAGEYRIDTYLPQEFAIGLPMTIRIEVMGPDPHQTPLHTVELRGPVVGFNGHHFSVRVEPQDLAKLTPLIEEGRRYKRSRKRPWKQVNADRLIAWQLYWRGENFWTGDEIWGQSPDTQTAFKETDNKAFKQYLQTPGNQGRRFFVITEAGRAAGLRDILPTENAKRTYRILDTSSNKFTLGVFTL